MSRLAWLLGDWAVPVIGVFPRLVGGNKTLIPWNYPSKEDTPIHNSAAVAPAKTAAEKTNPTAVPQKPRPCTKHSTASPRSTTSPVSSKIPGASTTRRRPRRRIRFGPILCRA